MTCERVQLRCFVWYPGRFLSRGLFKSTIPLHCYVNSVSTLYFYEEKKMKYAKGSLIGSPKFGRQHGSSHIRHREYSFRCNDSILRSMISASGTPELGSLFIPSNSMMQKWLPFECCFFGTKLEITNYLVTCIAVIWKSCGRWQQAKRAAIAGLDSNCIEDSVDVCSNSDFIFTHVICWILPSICTGKLLEQHLQSSKRTMWGEMS